MCEDFQRITQRTTSCTMRKLSNMSTLSRTGTQWEEGLFARVPDHAHNLGRRLHWIIRERDILCAGSLSRWRGRK